MMQVIHAVANAVIGETALPDGMSGVKPMRVTAFNQHHDSFDGDVLRGKEQMDVVWHDNKGV